jgi:aldose 1-epimerase
LISIFNNDLGLVLDQDQGARIISLQWRDMEFVTPFNGDIKGWGWYAMAPWAGRIKDGVIKDSKGMSYQLPTTYDHPNAIDGYGFHSSWQDLGSGRQLLEFPEPYKGATVIQHFEILDDALRWSLEYEANGCDLPFSLGFNPWITRDIGKGDSAVIDFKANKMLLRDSNYVPTGEYSPQSDGPWDESFTEVIGAPKITWPGAAVLSIESDASYWSINDQNDESISIQPVTAPPSAQLLGITGDSYIECLITFSEDFG